jgi:hypothetical protein
MQEEICTLKRAFSKAHGKRTVGGLIISPIETGGKTKGKKNVSDKIFSATGAFGSTT